MHSMFQYTGNEYYKGKGKNEPSINIFNDTRFKVSKNKLTGSVVELDDDSKMSTQH